MFLGFALPTTEPACDPCLERWQAAVQLHHHLRNAFEHLRMALHYGKLADPLPNRRVLVGGAQQLDEMSCDIARFRSYVADALNTRKG